METFELSFFFFFALFLAFLFSRRSHSRKATTVPRNYPLVGMLPALLGNWHRFHDYITEILIETGGTFAWKGPSFCNIDMLFTCDPANIHHIFSKKFAEYPKGPEFSKIFDILGDGIFNSDFESWEAHRRIILSLMTHPDFCASLETAVAGNIKTGLIPVLDHFCENGRVVDLQDVFQRLAFDTICNLVLDRDAGSLCVEMPYMECKKAFSDLLDGLLFRHILPEGVWRLQRWLGIGREKKLLEASKAFDDFIYPCVDAVEVEVEEESHDHYRLLASLRKEMVGMKGGSRKQLRDSAMNLLLAGTDTTSATLTWLFFLIAKNPNSEIKIREEMDSTSSSSQKLVYLHGAICETLRLFPVLPLQHKAPVRHDELPSGNKIKKSRKVIVSFYAVGRLEAVWGKDCLEFKPERWITSNGGVKHEPSYKFPAFNTGPRTCLGKEMSFVQMRMVAKAIIPHYNIKLVESHPVSPRHSIILHTNNGLKVTLSKRN